MKVKLKAKDEKEFLLQYLELFSAIRGPSSRLTEMEKELVVITVPMWFEDKYKYQMFSRKGKKRIEKLYEEKGSEIKSANLTTRISTLLEKKFLIRDAEGIIYLPTHVRKALTQYRKEGEFSVTIHYANSKSERGDISQSSDPA